MFIQIFLIYNENNVRIQDVLLCHNSARISFTRFLLTIILSCPISFSLIDRIRCFVFLFLSRHHSYANKEIQYRLNAFEHFRIVFYLISLNVQNLRHFQQNYRQKKIFESETRFQNNLLLNSSNSLHRKLLHSFSFVFSNQWFHPEKFNDENNVK